MGIQKWELTPRHTGQHGYPQHENPAVPRQKKNRVPERPTQLQRILPLRNCAGVEQVANFTNNEGDTSPLLENVNGAAKMLPQHAQNK